MATRIGINGFGRIGRCIVRALYERKLTDLEIVAINDLTDAGTLAHLLRYDSIHRGFTAQPVTHGEGFIGVGDHKIKILAEKDPNNLPWKDLGVDIVFECTGLFTDKAKAEAHIKGGAKKVLISAPAKNHDITIVMGVNDDKYDAAKHHVLSNGSCTTNCLAPSPHPKPSRPPGMIGSKKPEQVSAQPTTRLDAGRGTRCSRGHWGTLVNVIGGPCVRKHAARSQSLAGC